MLYHIILHCIVLHYTILYQEAVQDVPVEGEEVGHEERVGQRKGLRSAQVRAYDYRA